MRRYLASSILALTLCLILTPALAQEPASVPTLHPSGLEADHAQVWVADRVTDRVLRLDARTLRELGSAPIPCAEVSGLAMNGDTMWCLDVVEHRIYRFHPQTGLSTSSIEVDCPYPEGLAHDGNSLWMGCPRTATLQQIDPTDGTTIRAIPAPYRSTSGLGYGLDSLWVSDRSRDVVYQVDPATGWVLNILELDSPNPSGVAFADGEVWVVDYQTRHLTRIPIDQVEFRSVGEEKVEQVTYTHLLSNAGTTAWNSAELRLSIPSDRDGQKLGALNVTTNAPGGLTEVKDRFGQTVQVAVAKDVPPGREFWVRLEALVSLTKVHFFVDLRAVGPLKDIPRDIADLYLRNEAKYQIDHPAVVAAARSIVGDEKNAYRIVMGVLQFVISTMTYDLSGGWNAAPALLERKTGSCSEYTILTISLLRACGIPARYVGGVVLRGEDASVDYVFHRWVEAYIPGMGWLPIDPNKADTQWPGEQALGFTDLDPRFLVTTVGGGDSDLLAWQYNSIAEVSHTGPTSIRESTVGEWSPVPPPQPQVTR